MYVPEHLEDAVNDIVHWLLDSAEPWTRYRTLRDLLGLPEEDAAVAAARAALLAHPQVRQLMAQAATWPGRAIGRHNDASHPIHALGVLADFGVRVGDAKMAGIADAVLAHRSADGALQSLLNVAPAHGGTGEDVWSWMACDAPALLHALLALGLGEDERVQAAVAHLVGASGEAGWRCRCGPELGRFRGPGRKADPCPIATTLALKALSLAPGLLHSPAAHHGTEMLLEHWARRAEVKYYLFGVGSDFRKLKYPFIWYDILHVAEVLRRYPFVHADPRFREMVAAIAAQADAQGRCTAGSMYLAWKGWSFADKKQPSAWLTFLALRILRSVRTGVT